MTAVKPTYAPDDNGLLLVFSEPGDKATLDEFHDWYDNEHVPLRLPHIPAFRSGARYQVTSTDVSSKSPSFQATWAALYTISSNAMYDQPAYAHLRMNRSERERELLSRVATLDRRIYRCIADSAPGGIGSDEALRPRTEAETQRKARIVVCTSVTPKDKQAYDEWYEAEHLPLLSKVPGWTRTRRFELVDALIVGLQASQDNQDAQDVPLCLGVHEYSNPDFASTPEYKAALSTEWRTRVMGASYEHIVQRERKVMKLYRAWDAEAALKEARSRP